MAPEQSTAAVDLVVLAGQFLAVMAALTVGIWAVVEGVKKLPGLAGRGLWIAVALGPVLGVVAYAAGWLPAPPPKVPGMDYAFAALMGLVGTFASKVVHDKRQQARQGRLPQ